MSQLVRIAENALTIFILGGFGYIIYSSYKGNNALGRLRQNFRRFGGRGNG